MAAKQKNAFAKGKGGGNYGFPLLGVVVIILLVAGLLAWSLRMKGWAATACETGNLKLTAGQQSGAAGTIYQHMALTNTGKKKCTMAGFATAFLYGSDDNALGSSAAARPQPAPVDITLASGESAHTVLGYPQAGNFPPGVCSNAKSVSLKLYAPGSTTPLETPLEVAWCPGFSATALQPGS
jgi:hypothetical protein